MAFNLSNLSSTLTPNSAVKLMELARTNPMHYTASGITGALGPGSENIGASGAIGPSGSVSSADGTSFQDALLKAMDGVSSSQNKSDDLLQRVVADPDSVDAQDVTIAMAEANMSLNLAKTVLSRVVTAWKDVINTR
jgi:flagellar hook-basal body complex protein FliE